MKLTLSLLVLAVSLAAQDKPRDTLAANHAMQVTQVGEPLTAPQHIEQLQSTVDAQAKLIEWLKAEFSTLQQQVQASTAYFQSVLALQQLDKQKPTEPVVPKPAPQLPQSQPGK